jgi:hypothetical protein
MKDEAETLVVAFQAEPGTRRTLVPGSAWNHTSRGSASLCLAAMASAIPKLKNVPYDPRLSGWCVAGYEAEPPVVAFQAEPGTRGTRA